MRHKWLLCWGLGLSAACDAYDASLLSSSRLGAPAAVMTDDVGEGGANASAERAAGGAGTDASAADGGGRAVGEASAGGGDPSPRAGTGGAGVGGRAGVAGDGAGGAAANGGDNRATAGRGGAGEGGRSGGAGSGAGAGAGGGGGAAGAADGGGCGEPDSAIWSGNGHCYFPLSALASWNVSRDACSQRGAQLVTITSSDEQAFVAGLVATTPRWIGLSKFGAPAFTWIDGEALSYTNWDAGAPAVSGEVAAALRDGTQKWFDDAVTASHAALCERP